MSLKGSTLFDQHGCTLSRINERETNTKDNNQKFPAIIKNKEVKLNNDKKMDSIVI